MSEMIEWARLNCTISVDNESIIVGRYYNKAFRIFLKDGFAGICKLTDGKPTNWKGCLAAYDLQQFQTYLRCN